jgi:hypothetical protein
MPARVANLNECEDKKNCIKLTKLRVRINEPSAGFGRAGKQKPVSATAETGFVPTNRRRLLQEDELLQVCELA